MRKSDRVRHVLLAIIAIVISATVLSCSSFSADGHEHDRGPAPPPELPRLPSSSLGYVPHHPAVLARDVSGAYPTVSGNRRITQRVLLLGANGTEPAFLAARDALDRIGIPYRALNAREEDVTAAMLSDGLSTCHFSGVIVSTSGLAHLDPTSGTWQSALSLDEWQLLASFERACSAREIVWYAWPSADLGLVAGPAFDSTETVNGRLTSAGQTFFRRLKPAAQIPYRLVYGYRASIADPSTTRALIEAEGGGVLMALHVSADGRETLVSTVDASPYVTSSLLLEYDMLRWLNRDLFVGKKRAYLAPQVDDIFLDNDMWVIGQGNQGTTQFRIRGTDLTAFVSWQSQRQATLPAGSSFTTDMAFNGFGTLTSEFPDTTLLTAARLAGNRLVWLSHTWDHENMDAMTRAAAASEVTRNCHRGRTLLFNAFRCAELVTPEMSGLGSLNAVRGMYDGGVRFVVSDTSVTEQIRPGQPGTNPSFNVGRFNPLEPRIYHIPRHPTSIFYDVATPAAETDEYNSIYRSYYGRDLTYTEILDKDSAFGLFYLLQGDIDPLMFHQANLARYVDAGGQSRSLYADWIDTVLEKYLAVTNTPVLTLRMTELGAAMKARATLNSCGITATIVETGASTANLELRSAGACVVPVTGLSAATFGSVETYAGEPTTSVTMPTGSVRTIPVN